jgi:hypothetical protein
MVSDGRLLAGNPRDGGAPAPTVSVHVVESAVGVIVDRCSHCSAGALAFLGRRWMHAPPFFSSWYRYDLHVWLSGVLSHRELLVS